MIFYNAPWIFSGASLIYPHPVSNIHRAADLLSFTGFWKIINGLLDPVVASKVHFVTGTKELENLVPAEHIIKELGGPEDWEVKYIEPRSNENDRLRDTTTRDAILEERKALGDDLFRMNAEWISGSGGDSLNSRRDAVIKQLSDNYWRLDPYVRARSLLDRTRIIQEGGKIDFYPGSEAVPDVVITSEVGEKVAVEDTNGTLITAVEA